MPAHHHHHHYPHDHHHHQLCLACFREVPSLIESASNGSLAVQWGKLAGASILGIGVQFAGFAVIQTLGSVVLKSLGTVRNM